MGNENSVISMCISDSAHLCFQGDIEKSANKPAPELVKEKSVEDKKAEREKLRARLAELEGEIDMLDKQVQAPVDGTRSRKQSTESDHQGIWDYEH
mmetsp:Transcript_1523/g.2106  ORF Transcript_1523/g.2106 Transcript_1523/m.2106 type:complete len:96 (+) Transcript_1523:56-343(+)|eukprot:CAMPEP_0113934700 /NCGR_PEP_ID=MMETSP1339-20121228/1978_1 /TAXON_ID=94617 /ORGANISM="Fibrocapsa japonica" /LENGTH=95 /DNA_ID=CAMNT_0000936597 /DNA_START=50 /DNA_END=337 /DNA_ORIENTATION=+ /assembly_acc=CAM_ASM_000762